MKEKMIVAMLSLYCIFTVCDNGHTTKPPAAPPYTPRAVVMKDFPAGTFRMGADDYSAGGDQYPVHTVTLSAFSIQETEVTQGQYFSIMGVNPSWKNFTIRLRPENTEYPVEQVTWYDAVLYCNKLSKKDNLDTVYTYFSITGIPGNGCTFLDSLKIDYTKKGYRLPTEAEWEYACRGGTTTIYWWGNCIGSAGIGVSPNVI